VPEDNGSNRLLIGFLAGMMGAGVLFGLFQLIRSHYRVR
jgi:hypothetical protein